jgi:hypothetical protein
MISARDVQIASFSLTAAVLDENFLGKLEKDSYKPENYDFNSDS